MFSFGDEKKEIKPRDEYIPQSCDKMDVMNNIHNVCYMDSVLFSLLFKPTKFVTNNIINYNIDNFTFISDDVNCTEMQYEVIRLAESLNYKYKPWFGKCKVTNLLKAFEKCGKVSKKTISSYTDTSEQKDAYAFLEALMSVYSIKDLIYGYDSVNSSGEYYVSVTVYPENDGDKMSIQKAIDGVYAPEILKKKVQYSIINSDENHDLLIVEIDRSYNIQEGGDPLKNLRKVYIDEYVDIEIKGTDNKVKFQIDKIILHVGNTPSEGHYITYYKCDEKWYYYNDGGLITKAKVEEIKVSNYEDILKYEAISKTTVNNHSAIAFYRKVGGSPLDEYESLEELTPQPKVTDELVDDLPKDEETTTKFKDKPSKLVGEPPKDKEEESEENEDNIVKNINLTDTTLDVALRMLFERVSLPVNDLPRNEIVDAFAKKYRKDNPDTKLTVDSVNIIAYALINLSDSHHYKKEQVLFDKFADNLQGVNNGENFPKRFLFSLFNNVKKKPIVKRKTEEPQKSLLEPTLTMVEEDEFKSFEEDNVSKTELPKVYDIPNVIVFEDLPVAPKMNMIHKLPEKDYGKGWITSCEVEYVDLKPLIKKVSEMSDGEIKIKTADKDERKDESEASEEREDESEASEEEREDEDEDVSYDTAENNLLEFESAHDSTEDIIEKVSSEFSFKDNKLWPVLKNLPSNLKEKVKGLWEKLWTDAEENDGGTDVPVVEETGSKIKSIFKSVGIVISPTYWRAIMAAISTKIKSKIGLSSSNKRAKMLTNSIKSSQKDDKTSNSYRIVDYGLISAIGGTLTDPLSISTKPELTGGLLNIIEPLPQNIAYKPGTVGTTGTGAETPVYRFLEDRPIATLVMVTGTGVGTGTGTSSNLEGLYLKVGRDNRWVRLNKLLSDVSDPNIQNSIWYGKIGKFIIPYLNIEKN